MTRDQLATAVVVLEYLDQVGLGPRADHGDVADGPRRGGGRLLAPPRPRGQPGQDAGDRARRHQPGRVGRLGARGPRRPAGRRDDPARPAGARRIAGDAEHLLPVIEAARPRDVFDDPFADGAARARVRCCWSSTTAPTTRSSARTATGCRRRPPQHGVRVETVTTDADTEVARYASLVLNGRYAAEYLRRRARRATEPSRGGR